jgi:hypothetical protein
MPPFWQGLGQQSPRQKADLVIHRRDGRTDRVPVTVRIDTPIEVEYYAAGGITPARTRRVEMATSSVAAVLSFPTPTDAFSTYLKALLAQG